MYSNPCARTCLRDRHGWSFWMQALQPVEWDAGMYSHRYDTTSKWRSFASLKCRRSTTAINHGSHVFYGIYGTSVSHCLIRILMGIVKEDGWIYSYLATELLGAQCSSSISWMGWWADELVHQFCFLKALSAVSHKFSYMGQNMALSEIEDWSLGMKITVSCQCTADFQIQLLFPFRGGNKLSAGVQYISILSSWKLVTSTSFSEDACINFYFFPSCVLSVPFQSAEDGWTSTLKQWMA